MRKIMIVNMAVMLIAACQMKGNNAPASQETVATTTTPADETPVEGTELGNKFIDIELPAPDGKTLRAADIVAKSKYTLIDFWASWCPPCRAEIPFIVKVYADYHQRGFEVIGVSLDKNKQAWTSALEQMNMTWPQMSDLKGWECAGAALYNVRSIPANVLVDQKGIIVAKDLRGEGLLQTVSQLMK